MQRQNGMQIKKNKQTKHLKHNKISPTRPIKTSFKQKRTQQTDRPALHAYLLYIKIVFSNFDCSLFSSFNLQHRADPACTAAVASLFFSTTSYNKQSYKLHHKQSSRHSLTRSTATAYTTDRDAFDTLVTFFALLTQQ